MRGTEPYVPSSFYCSTQFELVLHTFTKVGKSFAIGSEVAKCEE